MKNNKSSAEERTVSMFPTVEHMDVRAQEATEDEPLAERVSMEQDTDRNRLQAFQAQEWVTAAFGRPEAKGNEYRVSKKGEHYYVETLAKTPGTPNAYGYVGLMVHERDLYAITAVLVQAVRAKQAGEKG